MTQLATRSRSFVLVAGGVAAGLSAPCRLYLARDARHDGSTSRPSLDPAARSLRRASIAEVVLDGCRISVELVEEVSRADLERLPTEGPAPFESEDK